MPRSHRPVGGPGMTGRVLMECLIASTKAHGVDVRPHHGAVGLVTDGGRVVGVECRRTTEDGDYVGDVIRVRGRAGVILSAGGFGFSSQMMAQNAPQWPTAFPLGTPGDDGTGIHLGASVGGGLDYMDMIAAWIFIYPPHSAVRGILVGPSGRRVCNEGFYGAAVAREVVRGHGGKAWLVFDQAVLERALSELPEQANPDMVERLTELWAPSGHPHAATVEELAGLIRIEPNALAATLAAYNRDAAAGNRDAKLKSPEYVQPMTTSPFHAIDFALQGGAMSLGGLTVDEDSGAVTRPDGSVIAGLFAAGRNAVGICSTSYVSGLSLGDCIFSGRRAGRHAAAAAARPS